MKTLTRRSFLNKSALGIGTAVLASRLPSFAGYTRMNRSVKVPIGFQVWPLRDILVKDFAGTLKMMAGMGYQSVEMCSPPGYVDSGFGPLMSMSAREMRRVINDAGLIFTSTHYGMDELRQSLDARIEFAKESGQKQMILSSFGLPENASLSDWQHAADELNHFGDKARQAGIQMGYHNHDMEFGKREGTLIYDALMQTFDPQLVKMQFQVAVIRLGFKATDYFRKYPGRFISSHLADWSATENKQVPIGQGIVDWMDFFAAAETGGVKNVFVEMDPGTFKESISFLRNLS